MRGVEQRCGVGRGEGEPGTDVRVQPLRSSLPLFVQPAILLCFGYFVFQTMAGVGLQTLGAVALNDTFGVPTVTDVLRELEKPGRDPRPSFTTARFSDGVEKITDLKPGMVLEGVVTNVAAFGAFVDVGVHQDGLVHVSAMSKSFVKDPRDVVKPGDTPSGIAEKTGVSLEQLEKANPDLDPQLLAPGQRIRIPQ